MGVGAQDHLSAAGEVLPHVLMNDGDVGRDVYAAVFLCGAEAEEVVVVVDGAPHGAERVVAVRQNVGQREALHPGGPCRLDDAHEGDVVGGHGVELDLQTFHGSRRIVSLEYAPGDGPPQGRRPVRVLSGQLADLSRLRLPDDLRPVDEVNALIVKFNHRKLPPVVKVA